MTKVFQAIDSTLDSLANYEFVLTKEPPKVGDIIKLVDSKTKNIKKFKVEYIQKIKKGYILKNANNTLVLKQIKQGDN